LTQTRCCGILLIALWRERKTACSFGSQDEVLLSLQCRHRA